MTLEDPRTSDARSVAAPGPGVGRGAVLAGLGAAGALSLLTPAPAEARPPHAGLPVLHPEDDWAATLARTPQVQLDPRSRYTLSSPVDLPAGTHIVGNGAEVTVPSRHGAFVVDGSRDVTLRDLRLLGERGEHAAGGRIDVPLETTHTAIRARRASNLRVTGCDLIGWRGAGIAMTGSPEDDYFSYGAQITGCRFEACYIGFSAADRAEFAVLSGNFFTACRLAIWSSAGNVAVTASTTVGCHGAYYSIARTSPFGEQDADNWGHGSISGCTMNHSVSGARRSWSAELEFPIGGAARDPGPGVVIEGLLPPTFTGNTLWYTDVTARDLPSTAWNLTGCTLSDLAIRQDGEAPVVLVGHQANGGQAHAPQLSGDVRDALAP